MKQKKFGFTIIEVIVSSFILSVVIFGVYKLIGQNALYISKSKNQNELNMILNSAFVCLKNFTFTANEEFSINFGSDQNNCVKGIVSNTYPIELASFSGKFRVFGKIISIEETNIPEISEIKVFKIDLNVISEHGDEIKKEVSVKKVQDL